MLQNNLQIVDILLKVTFDVTAVLRLRMLIPLSEKKYILLFMSVQDYNKSQAPVIICHIHFP